MNYKRTLVSLFAVLFFYLAGVLSAIYFIKIADSRKDRDHPEYFIKYYESGGKKEEGFTKEGVFVNYKFTYYLHPINQVMSIYIYPEYPENLKKLNREFYVIRLDKAGFIRKFEYYENGNVSNQVEFDTSKVVPSSAR